MVPSSYQNSSSLVRADPELSCTGSSEPSAVLCRVSQPSSVAESSRARFRVTRADIVAMNGTSASCTTVRRRRRRGSSTTITAFHSPTRIRGGGELPRSDESLQVSWSRRKRAASQARAAASQTRLRQNYSLAAQTCTRTNIFIYRLPADPQLHFPSHIELLKVRAALARSVLSLPRVLTFDFD